LGEFSSSDEIEDAIAQVWNVVTFDDVQSVFWDWIWRLVWVAENGDSRIKQDLLPHVDCMLKLGWGSETF
jgi:hypothetical protein